MNYYLLILCVTAISGTLQIPLELVVLVLFGREMLRNFRGFSAVPLIWIPIVLLLLIAINGMKNSHESYWNYGVYKSVLAGVYLVISMIVSQDSGMEKGKTTRNAMFIYMVYAVAFLFAEIPEQGLSNSFRLTDLGGGVVSPIKAARFFAVLGVMSLALKREWGQY